MGGGGKGDFAGAGEGIEGRRVGGEGDILPDALIFTGGNGGLFARGDFGGAFTDGA